MDKTRLTVAKKIYKIREAAKKYTVSDLKLASDSSDEKSEKLTRFMIRACDDAFGVSLPDNKEKCIERLYDYILDSDGLFSRRLYDMLGSWIIFLDHTQKPYYPHAPKGDDGYEEYEWLCKKIHANFLTLSDVPKRAKKSYALGREIIEFMGKVRDHDESIVAARDKLLADVAEKL